MKNMKIALATLTGALLMASCSQDQSLASLDSTTAQPVTTELHMEAVEATEEIMGEKAEKAKYEKVITKEIVKSEDCEYIVAGEVTFLKNGKTIAVIDFGDGTCDDVATKTSPREEAEEFSMAEWLKDKKEDECEDCDDDKEDDLDDKDEMDDKEDLDDDKDSDDPKKEEDKDLDKDDKDGEKDVKDDKKSDWEKKDFEKEEDK